MESDKPDPVKAAPQVFKVLFENEKVRVLEGNLKSGGKVPMHWHPSRVVYTLTNAKGKVILPDGSGSIESVKAGVAYWDEPKSFVFENLGGAARWVTVELKESKR
jgi:hypothetical protein